MFSAFSGPLIAQLPGYFLWKDTGSRYLGGNFNTAKLFGFRSADELVGITDYDIKCPAVTCADRWVSQDRLLVESGQSLLALETEVYADGEPKTLLLQKLPMYDQDQQVVGVQCYCVDVDTGSVKDLSRKLLVSNRQYVLAGKKQSYPIVERYPVEGLSVRETECLFFLMRGKSARAIGSRLSLSGRTVEYYLIRLKNKLKCTNKAQLIEKAIDLDLLSYVPKSLFDRGLI